MVSSAPPRVVLTGGTGLLGVHLVQALLDRGLDVTVLARRPDDAKSVLPDGVSVIACDLTMPLSDAVARAIHGCVAVIHAAGGYQASLAPGDHREALLALNVNAATALFRHAAAAGVDRFVAIGTAASVARADDGTAGSETAGVAEVVEHLPYLQAKVAMREALAPLAQEADTQLIEILPGALWGPGVTPGTAPFKLVEEFEHAEVPGVLDGGAMIVDVRDVASAIAAAVVHPAPASRYILGGRRVEMAELLPALEKVTGVKAPTRPIPNLVARLVSWLKPENLSPQTLRMLQAGTLVTSDLAAQDLGFTTRPLAETLVDTVAAVDARHPEAA